MISTRLAFSRVLLAGAGGLVAAAALWAAPAPRQAPEPSDAAQAQRDRDAPAPRPAGWSRATHSADGKPDYARLFSMDTVHEIRLSMSADSFKVMQDDLRTVAPGGFPGRGPGGPRGGRGGDQPPEFGAGAGFGGREGRGGRGPGRLTVRDPIYVPVSVSYDGKAWTHVGMRYKGNSSLASASTSQSGKVPFRLDFDRYEDEFPETKNQRFYGFSKLTFSSNFADDSQIREALATEVFRDRGVPAARAAFYRVMVDTGTGPEYWGLYTMIEDPSDGAMLDAQFGSRSGNLYKPDGPGADWTSFQKEGFEKKTNAKQADFSDVETAVAALHASQTDAAAWRTALEARFDVELFLRWLAVNTAIDNWDTYGAMPHNYYLYGDPAQKGRLRWIPWDHNMSFGAGPGGGGRGRPGGPPDGGRAGGGPPFGGPDAPFDGRGAGPGGRGRGGPFGPGNSNDPLHLQAGDRWPLISRLLADDVYRARYRSHLEFALQGLMAPAAIDARMHALHRLIASAVVGPQGEQGTRTTVGSPERFQESIDGPSGLKATIERRRQDIRTALAGAAR